MKVIALSDTHGLHEELIVPKGDVLIHAGDITDHGTKEEVISFLNWFEKQAHEYKIFIGGNHDVFLEDYPVELLELLPSNITYLNNRSFEIEGIKLWASPVSPDFEFMAFGKHRSEMAAHWQYMPEDIDVLITHTPPFGILDKSGEHYSLGCRDLLRKLGRVKMKYHIFGHIHASYGQIKVGDTTFINASNLDSYRGLVNEPIIFELSI